MAIGRMVSVGAGDAEEEVLSQTEDTRVVRRLEPGGHRLFIVKELLGRDAVERCRHETRILERLRGLVGIPQLAHGLADRNSDAASVIVMEDSGGVPLRNTLAAGTMSPLSLVVFARQLTAILSAVHGAGVVHKDLNPANILLVEGRPLLIDFSIATTFAEERPGFAPHDAIAGTLAYIAPEQTGRTGRTVDTRADLYALGATLYEMSTGRPPFDATDPLQLIHDQLAKTPVRVVEGQTGDSSALFGDHHEVARERTRRTLSKRGRLALRPHNP